MADGLLIQNYIDDARRLRVVMRINAADSDFAKKHNTEIRYFVDSNIVGMFMNPKDNIGYLNIFQKWVDSELIPSLTTLTSEFVFSGNLPGQRSMPILLTPGHWEELDSMLDGIEEKAEQAAKRLGPDDITAAQRGRHEIEPLIQRFKTRQINASTFVEEIGHILPRAVLDLLHGPLAEVRQLKRLHDSGHIRRADTMSWFDSELLKPNPNEVAQWSARLRRAARRQRHSQQPGPIEQYRRQNELNAMRRNRLDRDEENLMNDARSIVQLIELNKIAETGVKYIFISNHGAILSAYSEYRSEFRRRRTQAPPLNIRRPSEFAPLINLSAMSHGREDRKDIFFQIETAMDDLLIGDDGINTLASMAASGQIRKVQRRKQIDEQISQLKSSWSEAARLALTLGHEYIARRDDDYLQSIEDILKQEDVVGAALSHLRGTIHDVSSAHLRVVYLGAVARFLEITRNRAKQDIRFRARRAPLQLTEELFQHLIDSTPSDDFLDKLYRSKVDVPLERLRTSDGGLSFLFVACIAIAAEDWKSAQSVVSRSIEEIKRSAAPNQIALHEAFFCKALSIRFTMRSEEDIGTAQSLLEDCIRFYRTNKHPFGQAKSMAELGSVSLAFLYKYALLFRESSFSMSPRELSQLWIDSQKNLELALELLDDVTKPSRRFERVGLHVIGTIAAAIIYSSWIDPGAKIRNRFAPHDILAELESRIENWRTVSSEEDVPFMPRVFASILRFILAENADNKRNAGTAAKELLEALLKYANQLPELDGIQYRFFLDRVLAELQ